MPPFPQEEQLQQAKAPLPQQPQQTAPTQPQAQQVPDWEGALPAIAQRHGLDPELVRRVIHAESGGNPNAVSPPGARGLMQLMPDTAKRYGIDPNDPLQNLGAGTAELARLLKKYNNNYGRAIAAYNAGDAAVDKLESGIPAYPETQQYVLRVLSGYQPAQAAQMQDVQKQQARAVQHQQLPQQGWGQHIPQFFTGPTMQALNKYAIQPTERMGQAVAQQLGNVFRGETLNPQANIPGGPQMFSEGGPVPQGFKTPGFSQVPSEVAGAVGETIGGTIGDPKNWPFLASGTARPMLQRLISGGFGVQMGHAALETASDLYQNWDKYSPAERANRITKLGLTGFFAEESLAHAGGPVTDPRTGQVQRGMWGTPQPPAEAGGPGRGTQREPSQPAPVTQAPTPTPVQIAPQQRPSYGREGGAQQVTQAGQTAAQEVTGRTLGAQVPSTAGSAPIERGGPTGGAPSEQPVRGPSTAGPAPMPAAGEPEYRPAPSTIEDIQRSLGEARAGGLLPSARVGERRTGTEGPPAEGERRAGERRTLAERAKEQMFAPTAGGLTPGQELERTMRAGLPKPDIDEGAVWRYVTEKGIKDPQWYKDWTAKYGAADTKEQGKMLVQLQQELAQAKAKPAAAAPVAPTAASAQAQRAAAIQAIRRDPALSKQFGSANDAERERMIADAQRKTRVAQTPTATAAQPTGPTIEPVRGAQEPVGAPGEPVRPGTEPVRQPLSATRKVEEPKPYTPLPPEQRPRVSVEEMRAKRGEQAPPTSLPAYAPAERKPAEVAPGVPATPRPKAASAEEAEAWKATRRTEAEQREAAMKEEAAYKPKIERSPVGAALDRVLAPTLSTTRTGELREYSGDRRAELQQVIAQTKQAGPEAVTKARTEMQSRAQRAKALAEWGQLQLSKESYVREMRGEGGKKVGEEYSPGKLGRGAVPELSEAHKAWADSKGLTFDPRSGTDKAKMWRGELAGHTREAINRSLGNVMKEVGERNELTPEREQVVSGWERSRDALVNEIRKQARPTEAQLSELEKYIVGINTERGIAHMAERGPQVQVGPDGEILRESGVANQEAWNRFMGRTGHTHVPSYEDITSRVNELEKEAKEAGGVAEALGAPAAKPAGAQAEAPPLRATAPAGEAPAKTAPGPAKTAPDAELEALRKRVAELEAKEAPKPAVERAPEPVQARTPVEQPKSQPVAQEPTKAPVARPEAITEAEANKHYETALAAWRKEQYAGLEKLSPEVLRAAQQSPNISSAIWKAITNELADRTGKTGAPRGEAAPAAELERMTGEARPKPSPEAWKAYQEAREKVEEADAQAKAAHQDRLAEVERLRQVEPKDYTPEFIERMQRFGEQLKDIEGKHAFLTKVNEARAALSEGNDRAGYAAVKTALAGTELIAPQPGKMPVEPGAERAPEPRQPGMLTKAVLSEQSLDRLAERLEKLRPGEDKASLERRLQEISNKLEGYTDASGKKVLGLNERIRLNSKKMREMEDRGETERTRIDKNTGKPVTETWQQLYQRNLALGTERTELTDPKEGKIAGLEAAISAFAAPPVPKPAAEVPSKVESTKATVYGKPEQVLSPEGKKLGKEAPVIGEKIVQPAPIAPSEGMQGRIEEMQAQRRHLANLINSGYGDSAKGRELRKSIRRLEASIGIHAPAPPPGVKETLEGAGFLRATRQPTEPRMTAGEPEKAVYAPESKIPEDSAGMLHELLTEHGETTDLIDRFLKPIAQGRRLLTETEGNSIGRPILENLKKNLEGAEKGGQEAAMYISEASDRLDRALRALDEGRKAAAALPAEGRSTAMAQAFSDAVRIAKTGDVLETPKPVAKTPAAEPGANLETRLASTVTKLHSNADTLRKAVSDTWKKWGFDVGQVDAHIVGGRAKGTPVKEGSDVDVRIQLERQPSMEGKDPIDFMERRNAAMEEIRKQFVKTAGDDVHVLDFQGSGAPEGGIRLGTAQAKPVEAIRGISPELIAARARNIRKENPAMSLADAVKQAHEELKEQAGFLSFRGKKAKEGAESAIGRLFGKKAGAQQSNGPKLLERLQETSDAFKASRLLDEGLEERRFQQQGMRQRFMQGLKDLPKVPGLQKYMYRGAERGEKFESGMQKVFDEHIRDWADLAEQRYHQLRDAGHDVENYVPRIAIKKNTMWDRVLRGTGQYTMGSVLRQTANALKGRKFFRLEGPGLASDTVVHVGDDGGLTLWDNGQPTPLGINRGDLDANTDLKLKTATSDDITRHSGQEYLQHLYIATATNAMNLDNAWRAHEFLEAYKESPEFKNYAIKATPGDPIPDGWAHTKVPQLQGYAFEKHTADVLDRYQSQLDSRSGNFLDKFNYGLMSTIYWNPLKHGKNVIDHWATHHGLSTFMRPDQYGPMVRSFKKAWRAVIDGNDNYLHALDNGMPLRGRTVTNADISDAILKEVNVLPMHKDASGKWVFEPEASGIAKAWGYANPLKLYKNYMQAQRRLLFGLDDILRLQATYHHQELTGDSFKDSWKEVSKHLPDYTLPTHVGLRVPRTNIDIPSRALAQGFGSKLMIFGRYHYGRLKSYGYMAQDVFSREVPAKDRWKAVDRLMVPAVGMLLYATLGKYAAQKMTGRQDAEMSPSGATAVPWMIMRMLQGKSSPGRTAMSTFTPNPLVDWAARMGYGELSRPKPIGEAIKEAIGIKGDLTTPSRLQLSGGLLGEIGPLREAEQTRRGVTGQVDWSEAARRALFNVYVPKTSGGSRSTLPHLPRMPHRLR